MKCVNEVPPHSLKGLRVLLRAGLDVPIEHGEVADIFRLRAAAKTIEFLSRAGARTIIISHIGRDPKDTFAPVARALKTIVPVVYISDITGSQARMAVAEMREGETLLLENLRSDVRETENSQEFAKELASLADVYVNDAFSAAHRAHASIVGIPKFLQSYAGIQFCEEVKTLEPARTPPHPSLAIIGGAKFETKAPLIEQFLKSYDNVFVTGALMNDVFKAQGLPVGRSVISKAPPSHAVINHRKLIIPCDVLVEREDGQTEVKRPKQVLAGDKIVDIGPDTFAQLAPVISRAKFVLWNGPTGLYEDGYISWSHAIAEAVAASKATSIIGGNNTITTIKSSGVSEDAFTFLSTGGGAMLEFLLKGTLPGIKVLNK